MKVINFFGGPGAGKSTAAAGLFYEMKKRWMSVELVNEFAKELVLSGSSHMLSHQVAVFSEQEHRINRLQGQYEVAITDSPVLLSAIYAPNTYPASFKALVFDFFDTYDNINILVRRSHEYSAVGRVQKDNSHADAIADAMEEFLSANGVPYYAITASDASPLYLLHWLVHEGLVRLPDNIPPLPDDVRPPEGWLQPVLHTQSGPDGKPVRRTAETMARPYIPDWVIKS